MHFLRQLCIECHVYAVIPSSLKKVHVNVQVCVGAYSCIRKDQKDNRVRQAANVCVFEKGKWGANYRLRKILKIYSVPKGIAQVSKDIFIEVYMHQKYTHFGVQFGELWKICVPVQPVFLARSSIFLSSQKVPSCPFWIIFPCTSWRQLPFLFISPQISFAYSRTFCKYSQGVSVFLCPLHMHTMFLVFMHTVLALALCFFCFVLFLALLSKWVNIYRTRFHLLY